MPTLISARPFAELVGIAPRRFDQRRYRQPNLFPITPSEQGKRARFDAFDAVKLRAVLALECAGLDLAQAAKHVRSGAVPPEIMFDTGDDIHLAVWSTSKDSFRRLCGTMREIARARPTEPIAVLTVNLTAIRDEVAQRAMALLGLTVRHGQFQEPTP